MKTEKPNEQTELRSLNFENVLQVQILDPAPNKMFSEWQTSTTKFLRFNRAVPCAECGKRSKNHWTQLVSFKAHDMKGISFSLEHTGSGRVYPPLTPVCDSHPLAVAEFPEIPKPAKAKRGLAKSRDTA